MPRIVQATSAHEPVGSHTSDTTVSSATTLTPESGATHILIQALTQNVRLRLDGVNPTTTVGFQLVAGDPAILFRVPSDGDVRVIEETASAVVEYQWMR